MITTAFVTLWGKNVGRVVWDENRDIATFEYDSDFWMNGWNISPIKMPIKPGDHTIFSFPTLRYTDSDSTFKGLPGLLADSLPDRYGNELINAWMKSQGRQSDLNPVEALCFIGKRAIGALEFHPAYSGFRDHPISLEVKDLVRVANDILSGKEYFKSKLSKEEEKYILEIFKIGTSVGGMRAKALISFNPKTNEVRSGQVDAQPGFSHWIIKFDGIKDGELGEGSGHGRVEMAYHLMAKDCGINMSECRLFEEHGRAHFMTKRFDRIDNKKIHMQSWNALTHNDYNMAMGSYEELFRTMRSLKVPAFDYEQMFRRMVFNVLALNYDDHTKNFSFIMDEKFKKWKISPAYDVTYSYKPNSQWVHKHASSINGKRLGITKEDLLVFARRENIHRAESIIKQISDVVDQWPSYASSQNINPIKIREINHVLIRM